MNGSPCTIGLLASLRMATGNSGCATNQLSVRLQRSEQLDRKAEPVTPGDVPPCLTLSTVTYEGLSTYDFPVRHKFHCVLPIVTLCFEVGCAHQSIQDIWPSLLYG